jgi:hypothetical protein
MRTVVKPFANDGANISVAKVEMPFIISTGRREDRPQIRKIIRRHVMLGKRWKQSQASKSRALSIPPENPSPAEAQNRASSDVQEASKPTLLTKVGTDLSFIQFADTMEPYMFQDLLYCEPHFFPYISFIAVILGLI